MTARNGSGGHGGPVPFDLVPPPIVRTISVVPTAAIIRAALEKFPTLVPDGFSGRQRPLIEHEVETALSFLALLGSSRRGGVCSYFLKHICERYGAHHGRASYVSQGSVIAAAHGLRLPIKPRLVGASIGVDKTVLREVAKLYGGLV